MSDEERQLVDEARRALLEGVLHQARNRAGQNAKYLAEAYLALLGMREPGRDEPERR